MATLTYSKDEPSVEIESLDQIEQWFDQLAALCTPEFPGVFRLAVNGYELEIGFGLAESFVSIEHESGMPPYYMTVGDERAEGDLGFFLFGDHRTRIPRRNLIPTGQARDVVKEYVATGERSASVRWEKMTA